LRYLRDEEGLFFQGCEVASASFYNSLRAFFLTSYTFKRTVWLQSNIFFFFLFSITIHLDLATCMHWETSGAGGKSFLLLLGKIGLGNQRDIEKQSTGWPSFLLTESNLLLVDFCSLHLSFPKSLKLRARLTFHIPIFTHPLPSFRVLENLEEEETFGRLGRDGFDFDVTHM
jgi:hypothetical protein